MKRGDQVLELARQQRALLIDCLIEELQEGELTDALKATVAANDELIRILEQVCREGEAFQLEEKRHHA